MTKTSQHVLLAVRVTKEQKRAMDAIKDAEGIPLQKQVQLALSVYLDRKQVGATS
jgi:hypothetical protein